VLSLCTLSQIKASGALVRLGGDWSILLEMDEVKQGSRYSNRVNDPLPRNQLLGWSMFGLSGLLFLIDGIRAGAWMTIAASILWLAGCAAFVFKN